MRKTTIIRMLVCILTIIGTTTLTSCANEDNPAESQNKDVVGKWFAEYAKAGSVPDFYGNPQAFVKMVQFYEFNEDGTGCWVAFAIDAEGEAIQNYGSLTGDKDADGYFHYTISDDGTVNIGLANDHDDDLPMTWTLRLDGNKLTGSDSGIVYTLSPATKAQEELINKFDAEWHGGNGEDNEWKWGHPGEDR